MAGGRDRAAGRRIACDFAVAGVGIEPDVPACRRSQQQNGILVDELCRASAPDVYAAGDVANQLHPLFGRVRVEHYNNAEKQGRRRGQVDARFDALPTTTCTRFWSDQYDHKLEYVGHVDEVGRVRGPRQRAMTAS